MHPETWSPYAPFFVLYQSNTVVLTFAFRRAASGERWDGREIGGFPRILRFFAHRSILFYRCISLSSEVQNLTQWQLPVVLNIYFVWKDLRRPNLTQTPVIHKSVLVVDNVWPNYLSTPLFLESLSTLLSMPSPLPHRLQVCCHIDIENSKRSF